MELDAVTLFTIARETSSRIETLHARAREGKDIQAAKDFASYVQWSGLLKLIQVQTANLPEALKFDGELLAWKHKELLSTVHSQSKTLSKVVSIEYAQLEAVNHKLDLIAAHVSKLSPPIAETSEVGSPALHVIAGGVIP